MNLDAFKVARESDFICSRCLRAVCWHSLRLGYLTEDSFPEVKLGEGSDGLGSSIQEIDSVLKGPLAASRGDTHRAPELVPKATHIPWGSGRNPRVLQTQGAPPSAAGTTSRSSQLRVKCCEQLMLLGHGDAEVRAFCLSRAKPVTDCITMTRL